MVTTLDREIDLLFVRLDETKENRECKLGEKAEEHHNKILYLKGFNAANNFCDINFFKEWYEEFVPKFRKELNLNYKEIFRGAYTAIEMGKSHLKKEEIDKLSFHKSYSTFS